ncbi:MAG: glutamyl-tRNA reductase [Ornithinimicrobium sp.]
MSLLVVGLSHETAPLEVLEQIAQRPEAVQGLRDQILRAEDVAESMVLATCNRVEIVAEVDRFHGAVSDIAEAVAQASGYSRREVTELLYVHYDERAVHHLFSMTCGLNSMALGEPQVLGQVREALVLAQRAGSVGPLLNPLLQHALKVGKRAHAETDLDAVARSLVQRGLDLLAPGGPALTRARTVVVGAGAMAALATATVRASSSADLMIINRDPVKSSALADRHGASSGLWEDLTRHLATADLVISCTGATQPVISRDMVAAALDGRRQDRSLAFLDLSMPADVEPSVDRLPSVRRVGLADLHELHGASGRDSHVAQVLDDVRDVVTAEVAAYQVSLRAKAVAPTVAALRSRAGVVVQSEMERLSRRLPSLDGRESAEIRQAMARVVDKLLHTPTVRAKELYDDNGPEDYAKMLRELFDLDPHETVAVAAPPVVGPGDHS